MVTFHKGIGTVENLNGARPVQTSDISTLGIVFTAPDADASKFPLNEPIALVGGVSVLEGMGSAGTGPDAFAQILAEGMGISAVGVRVETEDNITDQIGLVVGDAGAQTGVHALKAAQSELGLKPRILLAPGFTSQRLDNARNPVVAKLLGIAEQRRAIVLADGPNTTKEAAVEYRGDWGSSRIYMTDPGVKVRSGGQSVVRPASASVAGVISRTDKKFGPHHSPSNQEFLGITGIARPIDFADGDPDCEADYLVKNQIATIVRDGGFRLWGNETTWTEPLNKFLPVVRTHDIIMDSVAEAHRWARDKPFSAQVILDIAETVNGFLRAQKAKGWTIGYEVWIDPELNTATTWANGDLYVSYDSEAPAPLQRIIFQFNRNTDYYAELAKDAMSEVARLA